MYPQYVWHGSFNVERGEPLTVGDVRAAAEGPPGAGGAPLQEPRRRPFGEGEGGDGDVLSLGMEGLPSGKLT